IGAAVGRSPPKVHVPFGLALWVARVAALIPKAPITVSNVLGSNQDTRIDTTPARVDFAFDPMGLDAGLDLVIAARGGREQERCDGERHREGISHWTQDCRLISHYLIDREPTGDLIERYCAAMKMNMSSSDMNDAEWRWLRRHPRSLRYLDAAAGFARPHSS